MADKSMLSSTQMSLYQHLSPRIWSQIPLSPVKPFVFTPAEMVKIIEG